MLTMKTDTPPLTADSDGTVRIGGTRVTLDTLVEAFYDGATAEAIKEQYPSLMLADIYGAISYYLNHQSEVEAYLQARAKQHQTVKVQNEIAFNPTGIRARLLAKRGSVA